MWQQLNMQIICISSYLCSFNRSLSHSDAVIMCRSFQIISRLVSFIWIKSFHCVYYLSDGEAGAQQSFRCFNAFVYE